MNAVRQHLEFEAEFMQRRDERWKNLAPQQFVLDHGIEGIWTPKPDDVEYGEAKNCYGNAAMLAFDRPEFTYVEGYACAGIVCGHAWVIDGDGNVIDPTWRHLDPECGFCFGNGTREEEIEWDDDGEAIGYEEQECSFCKGTRETPVTDRTGTMYLGVPFETEWLIATVMKKGTYGVLTGTLVPDEVSRDEALAHVVRVGALQS